VNKKPWKLSVVEMPEKRGEKGKICWSFCYYVLVWEI